MKSILFNCPLIFLILLSITLKVEAAPYCYINIAGQKVCLTDIGGVECGGNSACGSNNYELQRWAPEYIGDRPERLSNRKQLESALKKNQLEEKQYSGSKMLNLQNLKQ